MKTLFRSIAGLLLLCLQATMATAADAPDESAVRQKLVQAVLSTGDDQQKLLNELGDTGSKLVSDVLQVWTRGGIYSYDASDGSKIPVELEDQPDADGKARAIRIADGKFITDATGKELRFADSDLTAADTDM